MKKLFTACLISLGIGASAQNFQNIANDSTLSTLSSVHSDPILNIYEPLREDLWFWDDLFQDWILELKYEYVYAADGKLLHMVFRDEDNILIGEQLFSYDAEGRLDTLTTRYFDSILNQMVDDYRNIYAYDEWSNIIFESLEIFNGNNWEQVISAQIEFEYLTNGLFTSKIRSNYVYGNWQSSDIVLQEFDNSLRLVSRELQSFFDEIIGITPTLKFTLEYEAENMAPSQFTEYYYVSDLEVWMPSQRNTELSFHYYHSFDDYATTYKVIQSFDGAEWQNLSKSETTYDGQNYVELLSLFLSGFWLPDYRITKTFESNGLPSLHLEEFRIDGQWQTELAQEYIYDYDGPDDKISRVVRKEWDDKFQSNQNAQRRDFYYLPTNVQNLSPELMVKIFPNPSTEQIHIHIGNAAEKDSFTYFIIDAQGRTYQEGQFVGGHAVIGLQSLRPGYYFMQIQGKTGLRKWEKIFLQKNN